MPLSAPKSPSLNFRRSLGKFRVAAACTVTLLACTGNDGSSNEATGGSGVGGSGVGGSASGGVAGSPGSGGASGGAAAGQPGSGGASSGGSANGGANASGGTATSAGGALNGGATNRGGASGAGGAANRGGAGGMGAGGASSGGSAMNGGSSSGGGSAVEGPCDIYASGNTPCVAAHSTVRALYGAFNGSLYQVKRASDKTTKDIGVLSAGGFADAAAQDAFCMGTTCTISIIYDQSSRKNHLTSAPAGGAKNTPDNEANATALKLNVGGHSVYAIYVDKGIGYRNNKTSGVATGDQPESEYMVTSGKHYNNGCCFDYGNAETTNKDDGNGTMEAVYFGNCTGWGKGSGSGPWVMADLENGLFAGQTLSANQSNTPLTSDYVTAMIKGKAGRFAIKGGNAQSGELKTMYEGGRPSNGYDPMKKQGAIILGIGGDNSNSAVGSFFEGVITSGYASDDVDAKVQANIVAAGYGR